MTRPTTLERAFALAESGEYASVPELRIRLRSEGYDQVDAHLAGRSISRQLRALCDAARATRPDDRPSA
jgi:hypothetical protein